MKLTVIGTGYVGLVTGTCLAETGNDVTCVDNDRQKIALLREGKIPIYEPGLAELVSRNAEAGRLHFTADLAAATRSAKLVFLAVGTPPADDGSVDLSALWTVVAQIAPHLARDAVVVIKSTVPVGTNAAVAARLRELTGRDCDVASNPEFLKEGTAIDDFMKPDRVVLGARREAVFADPGRPLPALPADRQAAADHVAGKRRDDQVRGQLPAGHAGSASSTSWPTSARTRGPTSTKSAAASATTAASASPSSFPASATAEAAFPRTFRALAAIARAHGLPPRMLDAVHEVNVHQKTVLVEKIRRHFGDQLSGLTVAVWGLAFKPGTDDIREAPALALIDRLLARGVTLKVHDPEALENVRRQYGDRLTYCHRRDDALAGADALAIMTEWKHFVHPDFDADAAADAAAGRSSTAATSIIRSG